jgi:hypothetical protein
MTPQIPWYITFVSLATSLAIAFAVWRILASAAGRSGLTPATQRRLRIGTALFLGVWLGAAFLLAPAATTLVGRDRFYLTPVIPFFAVMPPALVLLALWRSTALRQVLAAAPLPQLIGVQVYRTIGVLFVILLALGELPRHFALPAGWGDIAIGVTAPLVALALARGVRGARTAALAWNVTGLLDLVVAVGMGTGFLAPFLAPELGPRVPPAPAMGVFPMILVPTFAVPVSVMLHLVALAKLLRQDIRLGTGLAPKVAR